MMLLVLVYDDLKRPAYGWQRNDETSDEAARHTQSKQEIRVCDIVRIEKHRAEIQMLET